jgi:hypothetical protein
MDTHKLQSKLGLLCTAEIKRLAEVADVSERAIWNIRSGQTVSASEPVRARLALGLRKVVRTKQKARNDA